MKKKLLLLSLILLVLAAFAPVRAEAQTSAKPVCMVKAKAGKKNISYSWQKVAGASSYKLYQTRCGTLTFKLIKSTTATSYTTKGLKTGLAYKACVVAYDKSGKKLVTSPCVHARTLGLKKAKDSNATKVTATAALKLVKGKKAQITAKVTGKDGSKPVLTGDHAPLFRYYSSNSSVASVDSKGQVTGKAAGTVIIYSVAPSGVYARTKVTVSAPDTSKTLTFTRNYMEYTDIAEVEKTASVSVKVKMDSFGDLIGTKGKLDSKYYDAFSTCLSDWPDATVYYEFVSHTNHDSDDKTAYVCIRFYIKSESGDIIPIFYNGAEGDIDCCFLADPSGAYMTASDKIPSKITVTLKDNSYPVPM